MIQTEPLLYSGNYCVLKDLGITRLPSLFDGKYVEYLGDGYGMPSSHSQFMAYFTTYVIILMYRR